MKAKSVVYTMQNSRARRKSRRLGSIVTSWEVCETTESTEEWRTEWSTNIQFMTTTEFLEKK